MWGRVTIDGVDLRETVTADQTGDVVTLTGQESHPPSTREFVTAAHANLVQLGGRTVPVVFTDKKVLTGFYVVEEAGSVLTDEQNGHVLTATWTVRLRRLGGIRDMETESLIPAIGRQNSHAVSPVFWHAPAGGSSSYLTGSTVPNLSISRESADGPVAVHLGIPATPPRWTASAPAFLNGAVRLLFDGFRRIGTKTPPLAVWEMHNGLVRVVSGVDGRLVVSAWNPATDSWGSAHAWGFTVNGTLVPGSPELTVIRNEPEMCIVRLTYPSSAAGRVQVDLTLRRGSRFVTGIIKRHSAATLAIVRATVAAGTNVTGGIRQTAADADGRRYVLGSSRAVTRDGAAAAISQASVTSLPFFVGHEVATTSGEAYADLLGQFIGSSGESVRVVQR